MNKLQVFKNEQFGEIRIANQDNEPWLCLTDLCTSLDLTSPSKVRERLNTKGVNIIPTLTNGGIQHLLYINESNLYKVIFQSRKKEAEKFTEWVTSEVLPQIRQTGGYIPSNENDSDDDIMAKALLIANRKIELKNNVIAQKERQLILQQPKVIFADAVSASSTSILVGDLAKLLKQNGIDIGANRLFERLRTEGYLIKQRGTSYNMPTQKSMELKLFEIKENSIVHSGGNIIISKTPVVTGKGQIYFINKYKELN